MNFPLNLSFKIIAISRQITVTDANGNGVYYVRQKIMKLKEAIEVFTDSSRKEKVADIKANKIIDWSATYNFFDCNGQQFGAIGRKGMMSLWKAHYEIMEDGEPDMHLQEEKPIVKVIDGLIGEIPIIGFISGFVLNPSYLITDAKTGEAVVRIRKVPSFFESKFVIDKIADFEANDELRVVMSTIMMVLLERDRG